MVTTAGDAFVILAPTGGKIKTMLAVRSIVTRRPWLRILGTRFRMALGLALELIPSALLCLGLIDTCSSDLVFAARAPADSAWPALDVCSASSEFEPTRPLSCVHTMSGLSIAAPKVADESVFPVSIIPHAWFALTEGLVLGLALVRDLGLALGFAVQRLGVQGLELLGLTLGLAALLPVLLRAIGFALGLTLVIALVFVLGLPDLAPSLVYVLGGLACGSGGLPEGKCFREI